MDDEVLQTLRRCFGLSYLYPYQRLVIANLLEAAGDPERPRRQVVILPTGAGKSLCFQLPALLLPGPTLVIYPLLALMADQERRLRGVEGLRPVTLRGGQSREERRRLFARVRSGESRLIIANPEALLTPAVLAELGSLGLAHIVIDEAHCVAEWGESFRPAYLRLGEIIAAAGGGGPREGVVTGGRGDGDGGCGGGGNDDGVIGGDGGRGPRGDVPGGPREAVVTGGRGVGDDGDGGGSRKAVVTGGRGVGYGGYGGGNDDGVIGGDGGRGPRGGVPGPRGGVPGGPREAVVTSGRDAGCGDGMRDAGGGGGERDGGGDGGGDGGRGPCGDVPGGPREGAVTGGRDLGGGGGMRDAGGGGGNGGGNDDDGLGPRGGVSVPPAAPREPPLVTAFTATASPPVLDKIESALFGGPGNARRVLGNPDRANISYAAAGAILKDLAVGSLLLRGEGPALVFCSSRLGAARLARYLQTFLPSRRHPGPPAAPLSPGAAAASREVRFYHAGLSRAEKAAVEDWFLPSRDGILVATCAYGMGVDKANIRRVIHRDCPPSVEAYLQEAGRAGRDGAPSRAVLLWGPGDEARARTAGPRQAALLACAQDPGGCRRERLLGLLGWDPGAPRPAPAPAACCDVCAGAAPSGRPREEAAVLDFIARNRRRYTRSDVTFHVARAWNCEDREAAALVAALIAQGKINEGGPRDPWGRTLR